ncbi:hypothetical protein [Streptomyces sp. NPDC056128]|uniref:hypothetical protein n=1 Tax=Streptomyces sp. NPDC056128 TaxID=3345721 RepID=UPI0035E175C1
MTVAEEAPRTAAAQPPVLDRRRRNVVFVTIMLGMLLAALDQTIDGNAQPKKESDHGGHTHKTDRYKKMKEAPNFPDKI